MSRLNKGRRVEVVEPKNLVDDELKVLWRVALSKGGSFLSAFRSAIFLQSQPISG